MRAHEREHPRDVTLLALLQHEADEEPLPFVTDGAECAWCGGAGCRACGDTGMHRERRR